MTSRRTTRSDGSPSSGGFTLIELLLVLTLVVLLASLIGPALSGSLGRLRLSAAAERLQTEWAATRLEAIRAGEPMAFRCELGSGRFTVSPLAAAASGESVEAAGAPRDDEITGVVFAQLSVGEPDDPAVDPAQPAWIVFRADGSTDNAFAVLESQDGRRKQVTLRGLTGGATVGSVSAATTRAGGTP